MNRRALLLAGPALVAAGCRGRDEDGGGAPVSETSRRGDVELLEEMARVKLDALAAYAGPHAPRSLLSAERAHWRRLARELRERGSAPPRPARRPDAQSTREEALDRMIAAESTSIALLIDVVPKFGDPDLRTLAAQMLTVEAQQLSVLRAEAGVPRLADAFVYGGRAE